MLSKVIQDQGTRKYQEDTYCRHVINHADNNVNLYGVFDGHNGADVSEYVAQHFHEVLHSEMMLTEQHEQFVFNAFKTMDEKAIGLGKNDIGSTAVIVLVDEHNIVAANCGDSMAIVGTRGQSLNLSMEHKVDNEKERLENSKAVITYFDGIGRLFGTLNLSRSFGDNYLKQFVVSNPFITKIKKQPSMLYIFIASDGIWDVFQKDEIHDIVLKNIYSNYDFKELNVEHTLQFIVRESRRRGSGDNVTIIFVDLSTSKKKIL